MKTKELTKKEKEIIKYIKQYKSDYYWDLPKSHVEMQAWCSDDEIATHLKTDKKTYLDLWKKWEVRIYQFELLNPNNKTKLDNRWVVCLDSRKEKLKDLCITHILISNKKTDWRFTIADSILRVIKYEYSNKWDYKIHIDESRDYNYNVMLIEEYLKIKLRLLPEYWKKSEFLETIKYNNDKCLN